MVEIKCAQWTSMDTRKHLKHLMKIKRQTLHDDLTSRTTWLHLGALFLIG